MGKILRSYGEDPQKLWGRASEVMGKSLRGYGEEPQGSKAACVRSGGLKIEGMEAKRTVVTFGMKCVSGQFF